MRVGEPSPGKEVGVPPPRVAAPSAVDQPLHGAAAASRQLVYRLLASTQAYSASAVTPSAARVDGSAGAQCAWLWQTAEDLFQQTVVLCQ